MTQNKMVPILFVVTAALWLVAILITEEVPAWTLAVYVAVGIPVVRRFSRSDKNDQPN